MKTKISTVNRHNPAALTTLAIALLVAFPVWSQTGPSAPISAMSAPIDPNPEPQRVEVTGRAINGYAVTNASVGTKSDTPLIELPVSVQVVTQQLLKDQNAVSLDQALGNVAGVRASNIGWAENIYLRGFSTSTYFRDGFRIDDPSGLGGLLTLSNVDSIEVLKGPGAILFGRVEPGGVVNLVTKQPQSASAQSLELSLGSWNHRSLNVDSTGPLDDDKKLLYRINASFEKSGLWVDNVSDQKVFVAPSLSWRVGNRTTVTFEASYLRARATEYQQAVVPYDTVSHSYQWGPRNANPTPFYFNPNTTFAGMSWSHDFGNDWTLRHKISHNRQDFSTPQILSEAFGPLSLVNGVWTVGLGSARLSGFTQSDGTVVDLTGHFTTGSARHTLLVGADHYRTTAYYDSHYSNPSGPFITVPLFSSTVASASSIPLDPDTYHATQTLTRSTGVYAQDQVKLPYDIDLLAGMRYQDVSTSGYANSGANLGGTGVPTPDTPTHETALTPRAGVLWQPTEHASVYASYAKSFGATNASAGTDWQGRPLAPESAKQYEVGVKAESADRKSSLSLALFDLTKTNVVAPDPAHPNGNGGFFPTTVGQIASRGIELTLQGELAPGWDVLAAYTHDHAYVKIGTSSYRQGSDMPYVPKDMLRLFGTYKIPQTWLAGLRLGGGLSWQGAAAGDYMDPSTSETDTSTIRSPSYLVFDAMASCDFRLANRKASAQLNVKNVFNRRYYTDAFMFVEPWGYVTHGAPRSVNASLKIEF